MLDWQPRFRVALHCSSACFGEALWHENLIVAIAAHARVILWACSQLSRGFPCGTTSSLCKSRMRVAPTFESPNQKLYLLTWFLTNHWGDLPQIRAFLVKKTLIIIDEFSKTKCYNSKHADMLKTRVFWVKFTDGLVTTGAIRSFQK